MGRTPLARLARHLRSHGRSRPRQHLQTFTNEPVIRYTYDESGDGILDSSGIEISVYKTKDDPPPPSLSHPNILNIYFNDIANGTTVCARKGMSFRKWIKAKRNPITRYRVDDNKKKPKATSIRIYFRRICSELLKAVWYVNEEGFSIKNLKERNLCVVDGVIKLWKFEVVPTSSETLEQNLIDLHTIIFKILQRSKRNIPDDMLNLLQLLKSSTTKETLLSHPALMLPVDRLSMIRELYEKQWYLGNLWSDAAQAFFIEADLDEWDKKLNSKMVGYILKCYNFRNTTRKPYRVKMSASVKDIHVVEDFFNFLRNLSYHVGEGGKVARLSKRRMDGIIFWAFGKQIVLFNEYLKPKQQT